jgi:hypothetical protein
MQMVVEPGRVWGPTEGGVHGGAIYDPTPVLDSKGVVHVIFSYVPARYMSRPPIPQAFELWEVTSADAGLTWSQPRNLSSIEPPLRQEEPRWIVRTAGGGGNGIQIKHGSHAGRLVVPGYHQYPHQNKIIDAKVNSECTLEEGMAVASKWCNDDYAKTCKASPGPLLARNSGSKKSPKSREWRCYSPSCLISDDSEYNVSSGCIEYCTDNATIATIVSTCKPALPPMSGRSHVLLSDDDGANWRLSPSFFPGTGEGSVAETGTDGGLIFIARRMWTPLHCVDPVISHCAGSMVSADGGETWSGAIDVGALPDPRCKNTVASWPAKGPGALVHGGAHATTGRTNVSALFSQDSGKTWGSEVMVWEYPRVGGYVAVQTWNETVGVVFENATCSISIGIIG